MSLQISPEITFQDLPELRRKTEAVSGFLLERLSEYLETLRPLLEPSRVLGKSGVASGRIAWMERNLAEFRQRYQEFGRPFRLPQEFDAESVAEFSSQLHVHPWEYLHEARHDGAAKKITITSPTRWVITYGTAYSPSRMRAAVTGREAGQPELIRQFVVLALLLNSVVSKSPNVLKLLHALRFNVELIPMEELHQLPLAIVQFPLSSFRPSDRLILEATAFSGVPAFIECVDLAAIRELRDPLREELKALVAQGRE